jgi:hypothetical protein
MLVQRSAGIVFVVFFCRKSKYVLLSRVSSSRLLEKEVYIAHQTTIVYLVHSFVSGKSDRSSADVINKKIRYPICLPK